MSDIKMLLSLAEEAGFSHFGELNMKALVFMPEVRDMCRADKCRSYGKSWRCPPACGTVSDASTLASEYSCGILVQTTGNLEDDFDIETMEETSKQHTAHFVSLLKKLRATCGDVLPMGAGACRLCAKCTYPDAPCRHPDDSYSSMEAYGLWVSRVCEPSSLPYYYGKQTITYTGCFLLK